MSGLAEVISLESRRPGGPRSRHLADPRPEPSVRRRRALAFCAALLALFAVLQVTDWWMQRNGRWVAASEIARLSPTIRDGLFSRTLADTAALCGLPEARSGFLRRYCVRQAQLLVQLPECNADCSRLAAPILADSPR
jgi:hypothetical protein